MTPEQEKAMAKRIADRIFLELLFGVIVGIAGGLLITIIVGWFLK